MNKVLEKLQPLRDFGGKALTSGLSDEIIVKFAATDPLLNQAIDEAVEVHRVLREEFADEIAKDEAEQVALVQAGIVNFYPEDGVNPYVSLAARGPWVITVKGAVLHDNGGYGMLGLGHAPDQVLDAMNKPQVMANVMTPNYSQLRLIHALRKEIGHNRGGCPYAHFLSLNSGSESVTLAARFVDVNTKLHTDPGGRHEGKTIKMLSLKGSFHGRTQRPARFSDSTRKTYGKYLASFRDHDDLLTVKPNCICDLRAVFAEAEANNIYIEAFFMEPVMGEGDPGMAITPKFYEEARRLTHEHGCLLLVDSIQAGLRATGCLSIVDYPGFENVEAPDMETYSKALNAGQYPLSVLAVTPQTSALYRKGIYGNTMTANPRAMDVACAVLGAITPELRQNIRDRGAEFIEKFQQVAGELEGKITKVQGTGLLFSVEVADQYKAYGADSLEEYLRLGGLGVIHGGENSLRYTPHFAITSQEVDLIVAATRQALLQGPRRELAQAS